MAGEWPIVALGEVAINLDTRRVPVKGSDRVPGPYPYYGASGVVDHVNGYLFDGSYLLVAEDGENLRTRQTPIAFMADGKFWVNNHAHILEGGDRALTRYLAYALSEADISAYLTGAVMPKLTQANLSLIPIPLPSLKEQGAIVELLGSLDDKIAVNRHMAVTLEEMARALFKSWFVDFDPVRAKAEGGDPRLPDATAVLFPNTFGESGLPVGWEERAFGDVFEIRNGNTPSTAEPRYWGGDHCWATPKDLSPLKSPVLLRTDRTLSADGVSVVNSGLLPAGSVLISTRAPIGYLAFATCPVAINQGIAGIVGKQLSTAFAWLWCAANIDRFLAVAGGSTFPEISKGTLRKLPMVVPTADVSEAFAALVDPIVARLVELTRENDRLAAVRDTLLPRLISGELRIRREAAQGEAA